MVKISFVGQGISEEDAITKFWKLVQLYEVKNKSNCLNAEIVEIGKEYDHDSKYAAGYALFRKKIEL